jgi:hypothetical protein
MDAVGLILGVLAVVAVPMGLAWWLLRRDR